MNKSGPVVFLSTISRILFVLALATGIGASLYPDRTGLTTLPIIGFVTFPLLILWCFVSVVVYFMYRSARKTTPESHAKTIRASFVVVATLTVLIGLLSLLFLL